MSNVKNDVKKIFKNLVAIVCVVILSSCSNGDTKVEENMKNEFGFYEITQDVAKGMMETEGVVILDVREDFEYEEGHIENSVLLPLGQVETSVQTVVPNKDETILVYCRSGNRSNKRQLF